MDYPHRDEVTVRYTVGEDKPFLAEWFKEDGVTRWFPCKDQVEIDDTVNRWIAYHQFRCALTACWEGKPVGMAALWLMPYRKVAHQTQFGMIVDEKYRGKGVGSILLNNLIHMAKEKFGIELLHLEVYTDNPAYHLYKKFGFREFGMQTHWVKDYKEDGEIEYVGRIFMERFI